MSTTVDNSKSAQEMLLSEARLAYRGGDLPRAEELFRRVVTEEKHHLEALNMLGLSVAQQGRLEEGLAHIDKAIAAHPQVGRPYFFRGNVLQHMQRNEEAVENFQKALAAEPDVAPIYLSHGISLNHLKRYEDAVFSFSKALELQPGFAEAHFNRGNALFYLQYFDDALRDYREAVKLLPDFAPFHNNLGLTLKSLGKFEQARSCFDKAIELDPSYLEAHNNRGVVLYALNLLDEALASYDHAITLRHDYAETHNNKGITLARLLRFEEALASYATAIELNPNYAEAFNNKAYALYEMKRYDEALENYNRAILINPHYADAYWNKSLLHLVQGDFEKGWKLFEWRWKKSDIQFKREFGKPQWDGAPLAGKTILLYAEQGLGDALQFCRYVTLIEAMGANLVLEMPLPLVQIVRSMKVKAKIIAHGETLPAFDLHCPLMSLPGILKTTLDTIPAQVPYLFSDAEKRQRWNEMLGQKIGLRVGLVWAGNFSHSRNHNRTAALADIIQVLEASPGAEFHALQRDIAIQDEALLVAHGITSHARHLQNFADTAALTEAMDIVISVDTTEAHLAGALGRNVWILLPFAPDFRWLSEGSESKWYPTATLFRQKQSGDWQNVFDEVASALKAASKVQA